MIKGLTLGSLKKYVVTNPRIFELVDGEARNNVFLHFWTASGKQRSVIVSGLIPFQRTYAREGERKIWTMIDMNPAL